MKKKNHNTKGKCVTTSSVQKKSSSGSERRGRVTVTDQLTANYEYITDDLLMESSSLYELSDVSDDSIPPTRKCKANSAGLPMKEKAVEEKALLKEVLARKQEECEMAENKGKSKHSTCNKVSLCHV